MVLLATPPPMYASRKTTQEKKRRDEINAKIRELQMIMQGEAMESDKMTQGDVLNRAVELVHRMESESPGPSTNPNRKGFFDGFTKIENLTYAFIKNLGMSADVCHDYLQRAKEAFDKDRCALSGRCSNSPFRRARRDEDSCSPAEMDRKEVKKNREQDRRDRQGEAFDALKNFIIANKLMSTHQVEKMQRLNTLDIIINYIRNKKNNFVSSHGQERTLYNCAVAEGQKTARSTAFGFFKTDRHLVVRCADLEKYLELAVNPKPLVGFPVFPPFPFFRQFPFFPMPPQTSPSYSLDSPPPSSDTSSSSIESPNENKEAPKKKNIKIFRPWE